MTSEQIGLWDAEAATFDDEPDHGLRDPAVRAAWRGLLGSRLSPAPARIADLGCGTGTLSVLLADEGYAVDGVDFSPEMVRRALTKVRGRADVTVTLADASDPPLDRAAYDAVLCRHVLWALPHPTVALARWAELLRPDGRLVLVEGSWSTGAGLTAVETMEFVEAVGLDAELSELDDAAYWGRGITDERYMVVARAGS